MTRKTRRFIFYIFLTSFIVIVYIIILYAQGYSFDWQKKSLVVTGAFYFRSSLKEADVYINNEYRGKTNKLIKRLPPKEYEVKISKVGYHDWQKTLAIKSKLVTEARNVLLVKKNSSLNQILPAGRQDTNYNVKYFSLSNDGKKVVYLTDKAAKEIDPAKQKVADPREIASYSQFALRLIDLVKGIDEQIYPAPFFVKNDAGFISLLPDLKNLSEISWSPDNKKLLLFFPDNRYYILDLPAQGLSAKIANLNELTKTLSNYKIYNIKNLSFHPQDSKRVYFYSENNLYFIDLDSPNLSQPLISDILTYKIYNNEILYLKYPGGEVYKTNLETSSFKKIFDIPFLKPEQAIVILTDEILIIDNNLYFFEPQIQVLRKIAGDIEAANFSIDGKKILWKAGSEIGIIWLEPYFAQPFKQKYEIETIMKTFERINQAIWYSKTNQHIIFTIGNTIKITETDGRDRRNTMDILSIKEPKIFYNAWNGKIYILSEDNLYWTEI